MFTNKEQAQIIILILKSLESTSRLENKNSKIKMLTIRTINLVQLNLKIKVKQFQDKKVRGHTLTELSTSDQFKGNSKQTKFNKLILQKSNKTNLFQVTKLSKNKKILWNILIIIKELYHR